MLFPSNMVLFQYSLLILALLSWTIQANDSVRTENNLLHQYEQPQLSNSNVDIDDESLATIVEKRYANKVIRGDARLWAIPYRFGKRGAMPYRFGRRAAMPIRFGKKSFLI